MKKLLACAAVIAVGYVKNAKVKEVVDVCIKKAPELVKCDCLKSLLHK